MAKYAPRLDCGWNIPAKVRSAIIDELNAWRPRDAIEKRDKKICALAFKENMNAAQIERLQDPEIVRYNKRRESLEEPLSSKGIIEIIYQHFPKLRRKRGYSVKTEGQRKRNDLRQNFDEITANKPKLCAICGSVENLRLHHIVPIDHGGTNDPLNLIYLCTACHNELHAKIYKTWGEPGHAKKTLAKSGGTEDKRAEPVKRTEQPRPPKHIKREKAGRPVETVICYNRETGKTEVRTANRETMLSLSTADEWEEIETKRTRSGRLESMIFSFAGNPIEPATKGGEKEKAPPERS